MVNRVSVQQEQVIVAIPSPYEQAAHPLRPDCRTRQALQSLDNIRFS